MSGEQQHWVPKFLIRSFADEGGRVFCLNIHNDIVTKPPPKHAAVGAGFNDFVIAGKAVSFERQLSKIEARAAPIVKRITASLSLGSLSQEDRRKIADFLAAQSFRTKAFRFGLDEQISRPDFGATFALLWRSALLTAGEIVRRPWALMIIDTHESFYLGDHPLVLQRTEEPKDGSDLGFDVEGVEAFMPLSPKCALYMPCRSIGAQVLSGYRKALSIHRAERSAALQGHRGLSPLLGAAQRVLRNSHALYEAFTTGAPLRSAPENIENFNYLQCSWAHEAVYSVSSDFSFARRVFRENPQYRSSPKVRIKEVDAPIDSFQRARQIGEA